MNDKELNSLIKSYIIKLGLCSEGKKAWNDNWTLSEIFDFCFSDMEFKVHSGFPTKEIILQYANEDLRHSKNIYCDEKVNGDIKGTAMFLGNCCGNLEITDSAILYLFDNSNFNIVCKEGSTVKVHWLDDSFVNLKAENGSDVVFYNRSNGTNFKLSGSIKNKSLR